MGMHGYTNHGRPQHAPMINISWLKDLKDGAVFVVGRFGAVHRLMQMRIKRFSGWLDAFYAEARQIVQQLFVDQLETFAVILVLRFAVRGQGVLETINHGDQAFDQAGGRTLGVLRALLLDPLAVVVEVCLAAEQRLAQIFKVGSELGHFRVSALGIRGGRFCFSRLVGAGCLRVVFPFGACSWVLLWHFWASPLKKVFQILFSVSLKSCAT